MRTRIPKNISKIEEIEQRCIDLVLRGVMELESKIFKGFAGLTFKDLQTLYRSIDDDKLVLLVDVGLTAQNALNKLMGASRKDKDLAEKISALSDDDAKELVGRIKALAGMRFVLQDEASHLA